MKIFRTLFWIAVLFLLFQFFVFGAINIGPVYIENNFFTISDLFGSDKTKYMSVPGTSIIKDTYTQEFIEVLDDGLDNDAYAVVLSYEFIPEQLTDSVIYQMKNIANELEAQGYSPETIQANIYYEDEPLYIVAAPFDAIKLEGAALLEELEIEDIRTTAYKIESESYVLDLLAEVDSVGNTVRITVEPLQETAEEFITDLTALSFMVVQYSPESKYIEYTIRKDTIELSTDDVLAYYNDEITINELYGSSFEKLEETDTNDYDNDDYSDGTYDYDSDDYDSAAETQTVTEPTTTTTSGDCTDSDKAYQEYIEAYNKLTSYMNAGEGDTPEAQAAYEDYKEKKDCYDQSVQ